MNAQARDAADDAFTFTTPGWMWDRDRTTVMRRARQRAQLKRKRADGDPIVRVTLVWPQETANSAA